MGVLSGIRHWALRDKLPIREISRRTCLSRNTIRKYLREGAVEPRLKTPSRPSKPDADADRLSAWLLAQTRKSRKERRTLKQMHADLVTLGYLPLSSSGGALLVHLLSKFYERTGVIITTYLSFLEWALVFGDAKRPAALLDRLTHRCHILATGNDSCRFKASSEAARKTRQQTAK